MIQRDVTKILGVGDVMLGRDITPRLQEAGVRVLDPETEELLRSSFCTGNLECVLIEGGRRNPLAHSALSCSAAIAEPVIKLFDVMSLANNHINDFGDIGIESTMAALARWKIGYVGVGENIDEATSPHLVDFESCSVAFYGATTVRNPARGRTKFVIAEPSEMLFAKVQESRKDGHFVVVHVHAAVGDTYHPAPEVVELHSRLRAAGAQVTIGHHSHRPQGYKLCQGSMSFYGLGDFIFDKLDSGRKYALGVRWSVNDAGPVEVLPFERGDDLVVQRVGVGAMGMIDEVNINLRDGRLREAYSSELSAVKESFLAEIVKDVRAGGALGLWYRLRAKGFRTALRRLTRRLRIR